MVDSNKFLNTDAVKANLVFSALYITAYELLKNTIIDNIKEFYSFEYRDGIPIPDKQYDIEVAKVHKDVLYASCLWLKQNDVITESEIEEITNIRKHRNQIAHELPKLLIDINLNLNIEYFMQIRKLLEKIEIWWIKNYEIPINSDFDGVEVDDKDIRPGRVTALDYVISVALADFDDQKRHGNR